MQPTQNFCKFNSPNKQKPSKQVLVMIKHCLRTSQINSIQTYVKTCLSLSLRVSLHLARADFIIHSQREIEVLFSTLKNSPYPLAQKLHKSPLVLILCINIHQEPITRSLELPHIPVTAFSKTHLVLVSIYLEFRSPQELW